MSADTSEPARSIVNKYQLARSDGETVTSKFYGDRTVKVVGRILANSQSDMETKLDTLKSWLNEQDEYLDVEVAGTTRRFTATATSLTTKLNGYFCQFEITFTTSAFGRDVAATTLDITTYVTNPSTYTQTIGGTYKANLNLDMTLTGSVIPYWESKYFQIYNPTTNQRMRFTRNWNIDERLVINGETKTATIYPATVTEIDDCDATTGWTSTHTLSAETSNMIEGTGALKVVMAGAAASTDFIKLNFADAIDFSATQGKVMIPVFIPTPTSGTVASLSFYIGKNATLAADYVYWTVTEAMGGSAILPNAWNYFVIDLSDDVTGTNGTPDRSATISLKVVLNATTTMQLNGALLDYLSINKASIVGEPLDYEGTFVDLNTGSCSLIFSDELTLLKLIPNAITANYYKRYL